MATLFTLPFAYVGQGIVPSDGAKLYFDAFGTSTPKDTYTTSALSTPNSNPVEADADGMFPAIWLSGAYSVTLKDKNGVQIWYAPEVLEDTAYSIQYAPTQTGSIPRTVNAKLSDVISVKDFGAKGNGVHDDTAAFQLAVDSNCDSIFVPDGDYIISSITISSPIVLYGTGTLKRNSAQASPVISVESSDVTIKSLSFSGYSFNTEPAARTAGDSAIKAYGASSVSPLSNITVESCKINGFADFGVYISYADNVRAINNSIEYCGYAGILFLSVSNGLICENTVTNISATAGSNFYGISITRDPSINTTDAIRCRYVVISDNIVGHVDKWTGIDAHAAYECSIHSNFVYECKNGIYAQYDSSVAAYKQPSEQVSISNNIVSGLSAALDNVIGIASLGLSAMPNTGINICNNTLYGCGNGAGDSIGAIYVNHTNNSIISSNTAEKSIQYGIAVMGTCDALIVDSNIFNGVRIGLATKYCAILNAVNITNSRFSNNVFRNNTGDASYTPSSGILYSGTSTGVLLSRNRIIDILSANYISNYNAATNNIWSELSWELEPVTVYDSGWTLTAGNTTETRSVALPKTMSGSVATGTAIADISRTNLAAGSYKIILYPKTYGASTYTVEAYTVDGAAFGSAYAIPFSLTVNAISWV